MNSITTKFLSQAKLPFVIEPTDKNITFSQFLDLIQTENSFFKENLLKYGGLLFRNFPVENAKDFAAVIKKMQTGDFVKYIGGDSPRRIIHEGVYTSTETPPSMHLPLHNELSYVKHFPSHIYFFCEVPPLANGETVVSDARKIYKALDKEVMASFLEKGVRYVSCYPSKNDIMHKLIKSHKSWVNVFETEDKMEVERKCRENDISFVWNKNDWLQISQVRPAALDHPDTHERVWFNQAHHFDLNRKFLGWWRYLGTKLVYCRKHTLLHDVFYGDNSRIPRDHLYHIMDVLEQESIYFPWQKGDVLVLDNILAMHGRAAFRGKRRILTAMTGK